MHSLYGFEQKNITAINECRSWKVPYFRPGDTVCVGIKIREGSKFRIQKFEGICISRSCSVTRIASAFVLRKVVGANAVDQLFRVYSPYLEYLRVVSYGKVRRAKLNYLRNVSGKKARVREDLLFTKKMQKKQLS